MVVCRREASVEKQNALLRVVGTRKAPTTLKGHQVFAGYRNGQLFIVIFRLVHIQHKDFKPILVPVKLGPMLE